MGSRCDFNCPTPRDSWGDNEAELENEMTPDKWTALIQAFGFPIFSAVACGYALWKLGSRLLDSHLAFIKRVEDSVEKLTQSIGAMTINSQTQTNVLNGIQHDTQISKQELEKQNDLLRRLPDANAQSLQKACRAEEVLKIKGIVHG
jgi:hypothetical protein